MLKRFLSLRAGAPLAFSLALCAAAGPVAPNAPAYWPNAPTPPMVWNSWDNFGTAFTRALLTDPEVLAVNQSSANNRQLSRQGHLIVWIADVPGSRDRYVALFNAQTAPDKTCVAVSFADLGIESAATVRDLWQRADLGVFRHEFSAKLPGHAAGRFRVSPR